MKFTINSEELLARIITASKAQSGKNALPILDCIAFSLQEDGALTITGGCESAQIYTTTHTVDHDGSGKVAINAKQLTGNLKEMASQPIVFNVNDETKKVTINYLNGKCSLMGENADDYPTLPFDDDNAEETYIDANILRNGIRSTIKHTTDDELRPMLGGVHIDCDPKEADGTPIDGINIVGTNGHSLGVFNYKTVAAFVPSFTIPATQAKVLMKLVGDQPVRVLTNGNRIKMENLSNDATFLFSKIEQTYPNYPAIIPKNNDINITVNRSALMSTLRRVGTCMSLVTKLIVLKVEGDNLHVSCEDYDFSNAAEEDIIIDNPKCGAITIGVNYGVISSVLESINSDDIIISMSDPTRAIIISPEQQAEGEHVLMLAMPQTINI